MTNRFMMFTLEPLFMGENVGDQIFLYINILGKPDNDYINQFKIPPNFKDCFQNYQIKEKKSLVNILNPKNIYNKQDISNVVDLLNNMLTFDYNARFSAKQCLKSKFFND